MKIHSIEWDSKTHKRIDLGLVEMTKREIQCFKKFDKDMKEGKEVLTTYEPTGCMIEFIMDWDVDAKKDRRGNIEITITKRKTAKKKKRRKKK